MNQEKIVIEVKEVTKQFLLHHHPATTLKKQIVSFFQRKKKPQKFEFITAVDNVSFTVKQSQSIALIGNNGSGKSTLMQIMGGILKPSNGKVSIQGRVAPLIELGAGFHPELNGIDNIYLNASLYGLSNKRINEKLNDIVDFSGLRKFIDTPVKNYSSGMYMRLAFSVAVHVEPDVLLADEILAVGDSEFQEKCHERIQMMQDKGMVLVLVTHSIEQAKQFCSHYIKLEQGKILELGKTSSL